MNFTNTTDISDAMRSKMNLNPITNFWRAMLDKYHYEIYLHLSYLFATNWLARITSRYLYLFRSDFLAYKTRHFVKYHLTFRTSDEIKTKTKEEIYK